MKVCFAGHREILLYGTLRNKLKDTVISLIEKGCTKFIMGSHGQFDTMALSVCRELRKEYKNIKIEVVITSLNKIKKEILYDDDFGKEYETPYNDVQTIFYDIEEEYFKRQIIISNQQMINESDILVCFVDETRTQSGAKRTLKYAKRKGLQIVNLSNN